MPPTDPSTIGEELCGKAEHSQQSAYLLIEERCILRTRGAEKAAGPYIKLLKHLSSKRSKELKDG